MSWLLLPLALAGCGDSDGDPVDVAKRFHALRVAADDRGLHELLADADRAAVPLGAFPSDLPGNLALELLGWGEAAADSARLLGAADDTAAVELHVGAARDTLRLVATNQPIGFWKLRLDRPRWRVTMRLSERVRLDSLASELRDGGRGDRDDELARAMAYLDVAERHPSLARPADLDAARSTLRRAAIADALRVQLRVETSISGNTFVAGHVENPSRARVATLTLVVTDAAGAEERIEVWDIPPGTTAPVWHLTRLRVGETRSRVERIQVF